MRQLTKISNFAGNTFAVWIIIFAILSYFIPEGFTWIAPHISLLLGIIMFGMGLTLTVDDFKAVFQSPKSVIIAAISQYTIMPLVAFGLAVLFKLPPELAAGVILVGCAPGGTASNVMTYLAKGNAALSVSATAVSTLLAPILTPFLTWLLARQWMEVSFWSMFISVVQVVLIPIVLGVLVQYFFKKQVEKSTAILPLVSVVGIVGVASAVVAVNRDNLLSNGLLIFLVVVLHNCLGLLLGFFVAKLLKLDYPSQKTISIEVGMQNSGLASTLAIGYFSPLAAIPSVIFSVWHNISGPLLATYWSRKGNEIQPPVSGVNIGK
ncbi:bile acid:sodium symporter family protein [Bacillus andreraoultii]|uniref:bile acid:sodium symporter family protein n=1 Tax=Bacillus andreraoultii TaxID=1499685 RepID=UPI000AB79603|nr:bile acid:sodium symporter family protein [Bacillus andreraoultii]